MGKAALFFDIDGTILSEITGEIPQSALESMRAAKAAGNLLFINTGRTFCSLPSKISQFEFDGFLCGCGTYLTYRDEVLFSSSISQPRGREIIDKMIACNLDGIMEGTDDIYLPSRMSRFERLESSRRYFRRAGLGVESYIEKGTFIYDKLFLYEDEQSDMESFVEYVKEDMDIIDRGDHTYECIQKGYSKATACEFILNKFGMDKEQAYVFGDSNNDLSMFQYATHAIAMGKHAKELEPHTEFVTNTVEEDGISRAICHYGLA